MGIKIYLLAFGQAWAEVEGPLLEVQPQQSHPASAPSLLVRVLVNGACTLAAEASLQGPLAADCGKEWCEGDPSKHPPMCQDAPEKLFAPADMI